MLKYRVQQYITGTIVCCWALVIVHACNSIAAKPADDIRQLLPAYVKDSFYLSGVNSFTTAKATLGRYFFYDRRLSVNQAKSCSSCHDPAFSFTDGYRRSIGAFGDNVQHNAPPLINLIYNKYLTLADSSLHFPEEQIRNPMFHNRPVELGWTGNEAMMVARIKKDSLYRKKLPALFPAEKDPFTIQNVQDCISSFVKTILSFNTPYDRFRFNKDSLALSAAQLRGMKLFFSDSLHCSSCHGGINFSRPVLIDNKGYSAYYQNTGLYNLNDRGDYPANDQGLYEYSHQTADIGKYRIPTLRNLAFTAPYLHDGSAAGLNDVIAIYENGGRKTNKGIYSGDGRKHPNKSQLLRGFALTGDQKKDLVNFLLSLSDSSLIKDPAYSNPFKTDETARQQ
jgi:cytochrome c peroxidase